MSRIDGRRMRAEAGVTLIELLLSVVLSSILIFAIAVGVMTYMRSAEATRTLLGETGELQVAAANFETDVHSAESVAKAPAVPACGTAPAGATQLVDFTWKDYTSPTTFTPVSVSYAYVASSNEVHRTACRNGTVASQSTLIRHVQPSQTPQVVCDGAAACPSTTKRVDITLPVCTVDVSGACHNAPIPATLTGVRRLP